MLVPQADSLQVLQRCKWKFLLFEGSFGLALDVDTKPETREVSFTLVQSKFMRDFEGSWVVEPLPDGGCLVEHVLKVTPLVAPPRAFAHYTSKIFMRQVEGILGDLQAEFRPDQP